MKKLMKSDSVDIDLNEVEGLELCDPDCGPMGYDGPVIRRLSENRIAVGQLVRDDDPAIFQMLEDDNMANVVIAENASTAELERLHAALGTTVHNGVLDEPVFSEMLDQTNRHGRALLESWVQDLAKRTLDPVFLQDEDQVQRLKAVDQDMLLSQEMNDPDLRDWAIRNAPSSVTISDGWIRSRIRRGIRNRDESLADLDCVKRHCNTADLAKEQAKTLLNDAPEDLDEVNVVEGAVDQWWADLVTEGGFGDKYAVPFKHAYHSSAGPISLSVTGTWPDFGERLGGVCLLESDQVEMCRKDADLYAFTRFRHDRTWGTADVELDPAFAEALGVGRYIQFSDLRKAESTIREWMDQAWRSGSGAFCVLPSARERGFIEAAETLASIIVDEIEDAMNGNVFVSIIDILEYDPVEGVWHVLEDQQHTCGGFIGDAWARDGLADMLPRAQEEPEPAALAA
ncbi:hypothetical protein TK90_2678 (plasmid) [Thioalkalivibrio sp. K90mix]|uniref:hypothetical protein n=1 Tax=Thioalkalivibrio sp. (strain K90mix) TaxID=396595 RepID=UPI000195A3C3|nr:hypothetical protein [Thioalkalivibrio sp. K90mix]ADC73165.1 hypothetical protein TK90_2678 [Thioalkalivibrio sp. K90mix]